MSKSRHKTSKSTKEDIEAAIPGKAAQPSAAELQLSALQQSTNSAASQNSNLQQLAALAHLFAQNMQTQNISAPSTTVSRGIIPGTAVGNTQQPGRFNVAINPALVSNLISRNAQGSSSTAFPTSFTL